jgi:hypothetical protein
LYRKRMRLAKTRIKVAPIEPGIASISPFSVEWRLESVFHPRIASADG